MTTRRPLIDLSGNTSELPAGDTIPADAIPDLSASYAPVSHTHSFASLTSKPTTLDGYGITDAVSDAELGIVSSALSSHLADTSNPHSVTKSQIGLGNVENKALSTWTGSTSITILGTIATGVWGGTPIAVDKGGTGATSAAGARSNLGLGSVATLHSITLGTHTTGNYVATITGTVNQITASSSTGNVTLSLPQNIHTTAIPRFAGLGIGDSASAGVIKLTGTLPQILVTCNDSTSSNSELRFVDSSTISGRLIYAGGNPAGDRYFGFLAYQDRDNNPLPIRFFVNLPLGLKEAMRLETTGNTTLCISSGTNVTIGSPLIGANASRVLGIANGTAPTTFPVVQLWAEAGELKVADTGGVVTQLSEHSRVAPDWLYDGDEFPERVARVEYNGYIQFVNITRMAKLVQSIAKIPDIQQALSCTEQQTNIIYQETIEQFLTRVPQEQTSDEA